jgi:hypothetical protein
MCLREKPARRHYSGPDAQPAASGISLVPGNSRVTEAIAGLAAGRSEGRPFACLYDRMQRSTQTINRR